MESVVTERPPLNLEIQDEIYPCSYFSYRVQEDVKSFNDLLQ